jgi:hypothetical protein
MAIGMITNLQGDMRESLMSILKDTSPLGGNWCVGNFGTSTALQTYHQWPTFSVARPTSVTGKAEASDMAVADLTAPVKSGNYTSILARPVVVSGTDRAVATSTNEDPLAFQKRIALKKLNADMEFALINGAGPTAGTSGVASVMAGLIGVITTNYSALTSAVSFVAARLEDILQVSWDAVGNEFVANTLLVPICIKRKISGFTTNVTQYTTETDKLYRNISTYEASTGVVTVVPHKDVAKAAGTASVFAIRPDLFKMAFLKGREPAWQEVARTGDADKGQYITEMTLESLAEKACVYQKGFMIEL